MAASSSVSKSISVNTTQGAARPLKRCTEAMSRSARLVDGVAVSDVFVEGARRQFI
jgi:hypothetical protein